MPKSLFECTSFVLGCNNYYEKVKIELISDEKMYLFFERGVRGGVSYICKRYSKANNKYLKADKPK